MISDALLWRVFMKQHSLQLKVVDIKLSVLSYALYML
jgi:hypothetical protein